MHFTVCRRAFVTLIHAAYYLLVVENWRWYSAVLVFVVVVVKNGALVECDGLLSDT